MPPRLSGQTSVFVSKSPLGIERKKELDNFAILTRKPRSYVRNRTWPIASALRSKIQLFKASKRELSKRLVEKDDGNEFTPFSDLQ